MFDRVLNTPLILEDFKMEERVTVLPQRFVRKNSSPVLTIINTYKMHPLDHSPCVSMNFI